ncbi:hypothetical protein GCK72_013563 [Caenorhabditis remanei]|uniref:Uncharacterized protein n=1 Tax=Caenorhabditis remanei TaxID=31234 RepID=A0A6A5GNW3_CAERE|nr:hypothetical protein GCK72_013563 [Caenorhabditis remanei]KAF1757108.1 hypothetical protein GCK72_013563 [Caenorhabditis remanei]
MKLVPLTFLLLFLCVFDSCLAQLISQQELLGTQVQGRYQYICGSDPYRFYSEFPCNMYPVCINGGFKINVGCTADYQCTPYSSNSVCVNNCCCTVPRIIGSGIVTTTRRFLDDSASIFNSFYVIVTVAAVLLL